MNSGEDADVRRAAVRLALKIVGMLLLLLALVGVSVFTMVTISQAEASNSALQDASRLTSPSQAPPGVYLSVYSNGRWVTPPDLPAGLPDQSAADTVQSTGRTVTSTVTIDGHPYVVRTTMVNGRITQVALSQHERQEETRRLLVALAFAGIAATIVAGLMAAWLARRSMRPLAEALALQRRFVADASHELRTPLTLLTTRAQILRRRLPKVPASDLGIAAVKDVDELVQDSRVLTEILEDLLVAADPRETREKLPIDLVEIADEVIESFRHEAQGRSIRLARIGDPSPVRIQGARTSIQRLFTALLSNALDYAQSEVTVEIVLQGKQAIIRVSDDGPGFPPGMEQQAFKRFSPARQDPSAQARSRHYGLGLTLVAEVATRHGGSVRIDSSQTGKPQDDASDGSPLMHLPGAVLVVQLPAAP